MTDIFLSYSSKDRERVRPIRHALAAQGYEVFWDQETPAGVDWNQWIMGHLSRSRLVIVAWSKNSVHSANVIHEATIAREDMKLVPVLLEALTTRDFPIGFYTTQAASLQDWSGQAAHKGYLDLMAAVRKRLGGNAGAIVEAARQDEAADIADLARRANAGDANAQLELGYRYFEGLFVAKDDREALRLWRCAADLGNAAAQHNLGALYSDGRGSLQKNEEEAVRLYRLATENGDPRAPFALGVLYLDGKGGLQKDEREAVRLMQLSAERGSAEGQFALGLFHRTGRASVPKDDRQACRLFKSAAEGGFAPALLALGMMYEEGIGGLAANRKEAIRLYRLAASQGLEEAIAALHGLGVKPW
jgi:TPR repeat protein